MVVSPDVPETSPETTQGIEYEIAATREEREAAFRLVYASYLRGGLGAMNAWRMRVTPYHLLPTTQVFVAKHRGEVIFTASLVADGELGLPMECVYGEAVAERRGRGMWLAEVSCLADRRAHLRGFLPVFLRISRLLVQYAVGQGMDALVLAVHPKHARFYRRYMQFEVMSPQTQYPTVRNRPAVALWLDFSRFEQELRTHQNFDTFFGDELPREVLQPQPISAAECDYFRPMIDPSFRLAPLDEGELFSRGAAHVA